MLEVTGSVAGCALGVFVYVLPDEDWGPKLDIPCDVLDRGERDRPDVVIHEVRWNLPWYPCQEPCPCWWELNQPKQASSKWKLSKVRCVNLNMHGFYVRLAHSQFLEQILALGSVRCSLHTWLVDIPCHAEQYRRACVRPRRESADKSPKCDQVMLVEVRLASSSAMYDRRAEWKPSRSHCHPGSSLAVPTARYQNA